MMINCRHRLIAIVFAGLAASCALAQVSPEGGAAEPSPDAASLAPSVVGELGRESWMISPHLRSDLALRFLEHVPDLAEPEARTFWRNREKRTAYTPSQYDALPESEREELTSRDFPPSFFYNTAYGSPLVYARVLDVAALHGVDSLEGKRVLDFGYGSIGQLRLMALMGAEAHGVDIEMALAALYSEPRDTGTLGRGSVTLHHGRWPAEEEIAAAIGGGYDLITSKNTLKAGYLHPAREADPQQLVVLGVEDDAFLKAVHDALKPGGLFVIYNICPPQNPAPGDKGAAGDTTYIPWADGWSPFSKEQFGAAGLEVLAFDVRDESALHPIFLALGYDDGKGLEALEASIFVWYTVVRRPD